MIKIEHIEISGIIPAIRGMRNPMNSWDLSDTKIDEKGNVVIGENDLELMCSLISAGSSHRKFMRMIQVTMDITAPFYWWKQFDTYKVGTVANSCSTMHKIMDKPFEKNDFSFENNLTAEEYFDKLLEALNDHREAYINYDELLKEEKIKKEITKKRIFNSLIQLLPSSYNQKRTVQINLESLMNVIEQRKNHKLDEWKEFCEIMTNDVIRKL